MAFFNVSEKIRAHKVYFTLLVILTIAMIIFGAYSAISISGGVLNINIDEVVYLRFLRNQTGFAYLIFGSLLNIIVFLSLIILCHIKKWLTPLGMLFFLYFIYSQTVILISLIMIYGFINVIILFIFLSLFLLVEFAIFILIMLELKSISGENRYFSCCFSPKTNIIYYLIILGILILLFCLSIVILKKFVLLLVF